MYQSALVSGITHRGSRGTRRLSWLFAAMLVGGCLPGPIGSQGPAGQDGRNAVVDKHEITVPWSCFVKSASTPTYFCRVNQIPALTQNQAVLAYVYAGVDQPTWWSLPFNYYFSADVTNYVHLGVDTGSSGTVFLEATHSKGVAPLSSTGSFQYRFYIVEKTSLAFLNETVDLRDAAAVEAALGEAQ